MLIIIQISLSVFIELNKCDSIEIVLVPDND